MRGSIQDRPFGKTVGLLARRGITGELVIQADGGCYRLVLQRGYVVAASSPAMADRAAAIALENDLMTPAEAEYVDRWMCAIPDADEVEICANVAMLSTADAHRLRRRTIARRAARIISLEYGEFELRPTITLPVVPDCEMHVGGVIYVAARTLMFPPRLHATVEQLGRSFELVRDSGHELADIGFGEHERPVLEALAAGVTLFTIQQRPEPQRSHSYAVIYALASCGLLYCETAPRMARGTQNPMQPPPLSVPQDVAIELATEPLTTTTAPDAYASALRAMRGNRMTEAIADLEYALRLTPDEPTYLGALAWARFCVAPDKHAIAGETRKLLGQAIELADTEVLAQQLYYLGLVERILEQHEQAMIHFREVLELDPRHAQAATELRFLSRRR